MSARVVTLCAVVGLLAAHDYEEQYIADLDKPVSTLQVRGVAGRRASLPCDVTSTQPRDSAYMVLWFNEADGEPLYSFDTRGRPNNQPKIWSSPSSFGPRALFKINKLAGPGQPTAALLVDGTRAADAGMYRCRVDFKNSPTRNLKINFTIIVPPEQPSITSGHNAQLTAGSPGSPDTLLCDEGDELHLVCTTRGGNPRPQLNWYLESSLLDDSYEGHDGVTSNSVLLPRLTRELLHARLLCQASNTELAPPLSTVLVLDINLRPLSVVIPDKPRHVPADRRREVSCRSEGARPPARLSWWKGGRLLRRGVTHFTENNVSVSSLSLVPTAEDDGRVLLCRAENPRLHNSSIEDSWKLSVHFVPLVSLTLGVNLNPEDIKEGDDVYFECSVRANPTVNKIVWYKDDKQIYQNSTGEWLLSDQSLVLQNVLRSSAGDYSCKAANSEGRATSNSVHLLVRYAPKCADVDGVEVVGTVKQQSVDVRCTVDASPPPAVFFWTFNSSREQTDIPASQHTRAGLSSTLRFTPMQDSDFGTLACWASNSVGQMTTPCYYKLVMAGKPSPPLNCTLVTESHDGVAVECQEGYDGGLPQTYHLEILEMPFFTVRYNLSNNESSPSFEVRGLDPQLSYKMSVYSVNSRGRSAPVTLYRHAARTPDKYTGNTLPLPLPPVLATLAALAALLAGGVCAVLAALYHRHSHRHSQTKPPLADALYMEGVETSSKLDTSYQSPVVDRTVYHHYGERVNKVTCHLAEEVDPDIIQGQCDRRPSHLEYCTSVPAAPAAPADCLYTTEPHTPRSPQSQSQSQSTVRVSRGLTARVPEASSRRGPGLGDDRSHRNVNETSI